MGPVSPEPPPPPPPDIVMTVVRAREGSDPCTDKPTVTGLVVVPLVTVRSICRVTLVLLKVYPVGTTSGTCSCTKVAPEGITNGSEVPSVSASAVACNTPVTVPVVYAVHWVTRVMAHVPAVTPYSGSVDDEVKMYPLVLEPTVLGMAGVDMVVATGLGVCTKNPATSSARASTSSVLSNKKRVSPPGCPGGPGGPRGPRAPRAPAGAQSVRQTVAGG